VLGTHLVFLGVTLWFWRQQPFVVVGVELLLLASAAVGLRLVGRAMQPLEHARRFRDLLQDRNYAARLQDQPDDELAGLVRGRPVRGELAPPGQPLDVRLDSTRAHGLLRTRLRGPREVWGSA